MSFEVIIAEENGTVGKFEDLLISKAEQEAKTGIIGKWIKLAELYFKQKERLSIYPWPDEFNDHTPEDEAPPVVKQLTRNTEFENLNRWGIQGGSTGNHRILFTIHNYYKVILLHYFDKKYNGDIRREDIVPAEVAYLEYCINDPSKYPITKG